MAGVATRVSMVANVSPDTIDFPDLVVGQHASRDVGTYIAGTTYSYGGPLLWKIPTTSGLPLFQLRCSTQKPKYRGH